MKKAWLILWFVIAILNHDRMDAEVSFVLAIIAVTYACYLVMQAEERRQSSNIKNK